MLKEIPGRTLKFRAKAKNPSIPAEAIQLGRLHYKIRKTFKDQSHGSNPRLPTSSHMTINHCVNAEYINILNRIATIYYDENIPSCPTFVQMK